MSNPIYGADNPDFTSQSGSAYKANLDALSAGLHVGSLGNPLLWLPMKNSLAFAPGVGSVLFSCSSTIRTYVDRYGVVQYVGPNLPRFEANGLLIEGASTNELLNSQSPTSWSAPTRASYSGTTTGPDGVASSADKLIEDGTSSATHYSSPGLWDTAPGDNSIVTAYFILKGDTRNWARVSILKKDATRLNVWFDITNGTVGTEVGGATGTIKPLAFGFYLCSISGDIVSGGSNPDAICYLADADGSSGYDGDGTSGFFVWGGQAEELPLASSFIVTAGTAVARAADDLALTINGNIPLQADPQAWFMDVNLLSHNIGVNQYAFKVAGEVQRILQASSGADNVTVFYGDGSITGPELTLGQTYRLGVRFDGTDATLWIDGVKEGTLVAPDVSDPLGTSIEIGQAENGNAALFGHLANLRIYDYSPNDREMALA